MKIDLKNYTAKQILGSYEFIFSQYLGGQLMPPEILEQVPTPYIFGKVCTELREQYLNRKMGVEEDIARIEKEQVEKLSQVMNIPKEKLVEIYNNLDFSI